MTQLRPTLQAVLRAFPRDRGFALVGGVAVSARTEPRFTRDLDFAFAVETDGEAEGILFELGRCGFPVFATVEHEITKRLSTARCRRDADSPFVDLLFDASGIEAEVVAGATPLVVLGVEVPVAAVGHLIAMKLVSRHPKRRPRDQQDLVALAGVADEAEWRRAATAVALVQQRGFSRGRDLVAGLQEIRELADD